MSITPEAHSVLQRTKEKLQAAYQAARRAETFGGTHVVISPLQPTVRLQDGTWGQDLEVALQVHPLFPGEALGGHTVPFEEARKMIHAEVLHSIRTINSSAGWRV